MPKSATGISEPRGTGASRPVSPPVQQHGFTLIEVLAVVAIAAIVVVLVLLRLGDTDSQRLDRQLERVAALIQAQCEQAVFQARPRGLRVHAEGYDFWQRVDGGWVPQPVDGISRPRQFGAGVSVELDVDGHAVRLDADAEVPQVTCEPLGGLTPFVLTLEAGDQRARLLTVNDRLELEFD